MKFIKSRSIFRPDLNLLMKILSWLLAGFTSRDPVDLNKVQPLLSKMYKIYKTRGGIGLILWCKNLRLALLHHLSGEYPSKMVEGVPVTKDGIPKFLVPILGKVKPYNTTLLRLVLTALFSTRVLKLGRLPDISSIKGGPDGSHPEMSKYSVSFWRELGYRPSATKVPRGVYFKTFHMTTKAGPNGHALWTSMVDLKLINSISKDLGEHLKYLGGPKFQRIYSTLTSVIDLLPSSIFPVEGRTLRRLSYFPDKETKVRTVAILDFWSQTVLKSFHDYLFKVLRKIPQDCTFNQGSFLGKTSGWKKFYSLDLTNATDRFPISVISDVLQGLLPKSFVESWVHVMVGLPFDFSLRGKSEKVFYAVGNPMGAYSSWNSFAIAHHYILFWCCKDLGMDWRSSKYVLLGDDILIGDSSLAKAYLEKMSALGVQISPLKTHESHELFEFAKRLVYNGEEITPFPISSLVESSHRFFLMVNLLKEEAGRGWFWRSGIPATVGAFYTTVLRYNRKFSAIIENRACSTEIMMNIMRGIITAEDGLITIFRNNNFLLPELDQYEAVMALSGTAKAIFSESNPLDYRQGQPLGDLAVNLVCDLTCIEGIPIEVADSLPSSIPLLAVYGQVELRYMEITRQISLVHTIGNGEWPLYLRTLALPISDKVFSERSSHTFARVSAVFGDRVTRDLKKQDQLYRRSMVY